MKRILGTLWSLTLASLLTLVAYLALYMIWGAILGEIENQKLKVFLIALMTTAAYGFVLAFLTKFRRSVAEDEVMADYKDRPYGSLVGDIKPVLKREMGTLICIIAVVMACFAFNTLDRMIFDKKAVSGITILWAPMCLFDTVFDIPVLDYVVSAAVDCVSYLVCLLLYRKKKYKYWMENK